MPLSSGSPLAPVVDLWLSLIEKSREHKHTVFGKTANECWQFFDGAHDFMYGKNALNSYGMYVDGGAVPETTFKMTLNKVAEFVQVFAPTMYFKNPYRQVNARKPEVPQLALQMLAQEIAQQQVSQQVGPMADPMLLQGFQQQVMMGFQQQMQAGLARDQAVAQLQQWVLNYLPNEFDLRAQSRLALDEGLIKGRGVLMHEMYTPPGSTVALPRSVWKGVDDILIDPDAHALRGPQGALWTAVMCQEPYWKVEREYGWPEGSLKNYTNYESSTRSAIIRDEKFGTHYRRRGDTSDLLTYYKIYSKCGMGQNLTQGEPNLGNDIDPLRETLNNFGDYTYIVVAEGIDTPLNLPPALMNADMAQPGVAEEIIKRVAWPVPFYKDDEWAFTEIDFHPIPGCAWPQAHMKPGLGELRFLNWAMSFLAGRIRTTSRVFIALAEHLDEEIKDSIQNGGDLTILTLKMNINKRIDEVVQFLEHPGVNKDIWDIINAVMQLFDKRVGLTELMYGISGSQLRSATEAQVKEERVNVRPDEMKEQVENWHTRVARKEGQMLRWFSGPEAVAPIFGETYDPSPQSMQFGGILTQLWQKYVYAPISDPKNAEKVVREYEYRIEAGSIRKPNIERDQANMDQAMQVIFQPLLSMYQSTGDPTQVNAFLADWAKTRQLDATPYMFTAFTPMPMAPPEGGGSPPPG